MQKYIAVIFLLTCLQTHANVIGWKEVDNFEVSKVWINLKDEKLRVSTETTNIEGPKQFKKLFNSNQFESFKEAKKKMLEKFGIGSWELDKKEWVQIEGREYMKLAGSFIDNTGKKVYFNEFHYPNGNKNQISIFSSESMESLASTEINVFLKSKGN